MTSPGGLGAFGTGEWVSRTKVAADLGYADQAHLTSDFRAATGQTSAAYAPSQSAQRSDQMH